MLFGVSASFSAMPLTIRPGAGPADIAALKAHWDFTRHRSRNLNPERRRRAFAFGHRHLIVRLYALAKE
jgi:hypothetical protein